MAWKWYELVLRALNAQAFFFLTMLIGRFTADIYQISKEKEHKKYFWSFQTILSYNKVFLKYLTEIKYK